MASIGNTGSNPPAAAAAAVERGWPWAAAVSLSQYQVVTYSTPHARKTFSTNHRQYAALLVSQTATMHPSADAKALIGSVGS
eukprot:COSAG05_NODE_1970_length_3768_cov_1.710548_3_plen_82_part_00